jgi:hypothetical protein
VPLERTHSAAPVVKTSIKSFNKALGESTFSLLANHSHRHGSKTPSPENVKQALSSLCTVSLEALPPPSIMVRPTEASNSVLSPLESTKTPPVPTAALLNAIPVEVMAEFLAKETTPVPVEALSNSEPVAALPSSLRAHIAALHSSLRARAPAWSIPAARSALHQGDCVLPPAEHSPVPFISVCPNEPSTGASPSVKPSFRQVSAIRDFTGPPLPPPTCAPVDTTSCVNMRLSPRAPEWSPAPGVSPKEELKLLIARSTQQLQSSTYWSEFINKCKDPRGDLHPNVLHLPHRAAHLLNRLRISGATVARSSAPWSLRQKLSALERGSHQSAKQHVDFLCSEFVNMIKKGQWILLPATQVMNNRNLRLIPLGVVPQRERRPRTICDYSSFLVNDDTIELCPTESMQFGRSLLRILQKIARSDPRLGPVYLFKIDISDGFYRIAIRSEDVPKLSVMFPTAPGEEQLIGLPLVLTMGWKKSPPLFTAASETVADLANDKLQSCQASMPHHLDVLSETPITPEPHPLVSTTGPETLALPSGTRFHSSKPVPVKYWDVYVDDFVGMVQGNSKHRQHMKRSLLSPLDEVLRRVDGQDNVHRQDPASVKKMLKGDATWAARKVVLGWMLDTCAMTIQLPPHRVTHLFELLDSFAPKQRRTTVNKWQKLLGELRSMVLGITGGKGLFSVLQEALRTKCDHGSRVRISSAVHRILADFCWLAQDLTRRPTRIAEIIPKTKPDTLGDKDAAATGMGGVHFVPQLDGTMQPMLWRCPFPSNVQQRLVSYDNPQGDINSSELELAASVAHHDVLAQAFDVQEATIHNSSDNIATVWWQRKGATSSSGPTARLLRLQALHQHHYRYIPLFDYIGGEANAMADDCSRLWHLSDSQLLAHFA